MRAVNGQKVNKQKNPESSKNRAESRERSDKDKFRDDGGNVVRVRRRNTAVLAVHVQKSSGTMAVL
jgi:hypothetical protein